MVARRQRKQARFPFDEDVRTPPAQIEYADASVEPDASRRSHEETPGTHGQKALTVHGAWTWLWSAIGTWMEGRAKARARAARQAAGLAGKVAFLELLASILLMIPSSGTAIFTYFGIAMPLSETGVSVLSKGEALAFALTVGILIWLAWAFIFALATRLTGPRLRAGLLAGGLMVAAIAGLDSPFAMMALAGGQAAQMSLVDVSHVYEAARGALVARATATRGLLPAIKVQAERFAKLKVQEEKSGTYSGKGRPGKVSASFGQIADLLGGLARELEAGLAKIDALQPDLAASFAQMKAFAYREGPIRPRMEGISSAADRIDAQLSQAAQYEFTASIEATLASLDSSLLQPQATGDAFARAQAAQVGAIAAMVRPVADSLRAGLSTLQHAGSAAVVSRRPEGPLTAIRTYWVALLPHWLAALFIDLSPLGLLVLLMAAQREATRDDDRSAGGIVPSDQL